MLAVVSILLLFAGCATVEIEQQQATSLEILEEEGGYRVIDSGMPVLFYQLEPTSLDGRYQRSNYVHPLYGLDGEVLTEDFPEDHPHHRGVFWTWHQVLIGDIRAGDPWLAQGFSWSVEEARVLPERDGLYLRHRWFSPDYSEGREPIAEETAEVVVHPANGTVRMIDFDIRLRALQQDVRVGGSEDDKGYGGFSLRVKMVPDIRFAAATGVVAPSRAPIDAGNWVDFSADFGGRGSPSGIAILVHPDSAGYPQPWILRSPASPSMQNPVWPGPDPAPVPADGHVRLRYRLVVHRGTAADVDLAAMAETFAALPTR
ncbi:MAG: PmoA family protein [Bryobacterales bacterium]|nr:PmoA family protein [Bryobacterales bacterium]